MKTFDLEKTDFALFSASPFTVISDSPYTVKNGYGLALVDKATPGEVLENNFSEIHTVCAHDLATANKLVSFGYERGVTCFQFVYTGKTAPRLSGNLTIKQLTENELDFVKKGYGGGEYAERLVKQGKIYGGFNGKVPIGFIGVHDANTIGLIFVSPKHRKKGYAKELLSFMIEKQLSKGLTPLTQVVTDNLPSIALHESLGFKRLTTQTFWLKR